MQEQEYGLKFEMRCRNYRYDGTGCDGTFWDWPLVLNTGNQLCSKCVRKAANKITEEQLELLELFSLYTDKTPL